MGRMQVLSMFAESWTLRDVSRVPARATAETICLSLMEWSDWRDEYVM